MARVNRTCLVHALICCSAGRDTVCRVWTENSPTLPHISCMAPIFATAFSTPMPDLKRPSSPLHQDCLADKKVCSTVAGTGSHS